MRTRSAGNRAWIPKALPVRRWQAKQWHMEIRIGSPSAVSRSCPQLQAASRVAMAADPTEAGCLLFAVSLTAQTASDRGVGPVLAPKPRLMERGFEPTGDLS